jgi:two-component sensor histidine kinase
MPLILVEEITHRVLNEYTHAIATLSLAAADTADHKARLALKALAGRMRAYADVHRALCAPAAGGMSDLGQYLQTLCVAMASGSLRDRGVHLTLIQSEIPMAADRCWRVGLIASELITNAMRHAFGEESGQVVVEVRANGARTYCQVSDNGKGHADPRPGRGSAIIEALTRELGGRVEWTFAPDGTTVVLSIPSEAVH